MRLASPQGMRQHKGDGVADKPLCLGRLAATTREAGRRGWARGALRDSGLPSPPFPRGSRGYVTVVKARETGALRFGSPATCKAGVFCDLHAGRARVGRGGFRRP